MLVLDHRSPHWGEMWSPNGRRRRTPQPRNDRSVCIAHQSWHLLFHARYRCPEHISPDDVVLNVVPSADATGTVVAPLLNVVIVKLDNPAR